MIYLNWLSVKVFGNPCLFFEGVVGAICCAGIFDIWTNFASEMLQEINKIGPRMSQGKPTLVQGGTPQRFRKTGRKKNAPPQETAMQLVPKWDPKSQGWRYCWWYFSIFSRIIFGIAFFVFQWFGECFLHEFHALFGCLRVSFWN